MSRIGKKPVSVPSGVEVTINPPCVSAKGPKGELSVKVNKLVSVIQRESDGKKIIEVSVKDEKDQHSSTQWGTARALIANLVSGVSVGFTKTLEVVGVGYKVSLKGDTIVMNMGYSHEVLFKLPEGVKASIENNTITISGADKQVVGHVASQIRKVRKPEPYKGKGIKYSTEVVRRKAGKAAKTAA